jgi:hypothetical protein
MMQPEAVTAMTPHLRSLMENFVLNYIEVSGLYIIS